jgi:hypothetical protein
VLLGPKDYKRLKHGKDVSFDAKHQYLKPQLLARAFVHHKFVMDLPDGIWIDEKTGKTAPCRVMAVKAYSRTQESYIRQTPLISVQFVCVLITAVPIIKLFAWGEGDSGGHVLR